MLCDYCHHPIEHGGLTINYEQFYHYDCAEEHLSELPLIDARDFNNALTEILILK